MKRLFFHRDCPPYMAGETAGFIGADARVANLVARGIAIEVDADGRRIAEAAPVIPADGNDVFEERIRRETPMSEQAEQTKDEKRPSDTKSVDQPPVDKMLRGPTRRK